MKENMLNPFASEAIVTENETGQFYIELIQGKPLIELEKEAYKLFVFTQNKSKARLHQLVSDWT